MKTFNKNKVYKAINKIEVIITDLKEGYLGEFEDEDPVASIKGTLSNLLEQLAEAKNEVDKLTK